MTKSKLSCQSEIHLAGWSVGETLRLKLLTLSSYLKETHNPCDVLVCMAYLCEVWPKGSRVMSLFHISIFPVAKQA